MVKKTPQSKPKAGINEVIDNIPGRRAPVYRADAGAHDVVLAD